jgi:glycosyltransferase involved in cell wall biosynthesis
MKIAFVGSRGIPAHYSGFETAIEHLSELLSERGHEIIVYCRKRDVSKVCTEFMGARLIHMPSLRNKYLDTLSHSFVSSLHMIFRARPDVAVYVIAGNSPMLMVAKLGRIPAVINVDGLDWTREKWPFWAKSYIRLAEWLAPRLARVITDAREVKQYYHDKFDRETVYIPYGAAPPKSRGTATLDKFALKPGKYVLYVGRFVPENKVHLLVGAYRKVKTDLPLVVVGGSSYEDEFVRRVKALADERVVFTGYVFGDGYDELRAHAAMMVVPHGSGGTHPVLVEALAAGQCVIVNDNPENREVVGPAGLYFDEAAGEDDLAVKLQLVLDDDALAAEMRTHAVERARIYSWERVALAYETVIRAAFQGTQVQGIAFDGRTPESWWRRVGDAPLPPGVGNRRAGRDRRATPEATTEATTEAAPVAERAVAERVTSESLANESAGPSVAQSDGEIV